MRRAQSPLRLALVAVVVGLTLVILTGGHVGVIVLVGGIVLAFMRWRQLRR